MAHDPPELATRERRAHWLGCLARTPPVKTCADAVSDKQKSAAHRTGDCICLIIFTLAISRVNLPKRKTTDDFQSGSPFKLKCIEVGRSNRRGSVRLPISVGGVND